MPVNLSGMMHNTEVEIYSHTPLGAFVKLTAANWLIYFSNQILPNIICNVSKLQYLARQCNIEYLTTSEYVFNSNEGLGGNWGFSSAITDSKNLKQLTTTLSMWRKKQPLWPRPQPCVRKHFPLISFLSQWKIQLISRKESVHSTSQK